MGIEFTESQRRAIEHRGSTLLVSAAAGSGKTRVLTERLLRLVTDPAAPADIDRFLVITFTRAAAAELRSRIMGALAALAAERPGDARIRRQQTLCCRAPIGTIHSFCSSIIREYAQVLGVSPAFTVLDEDRAAAMKQTIASRLLDRRYETIDTDAPFRLLADSVGAGRDDSRLQSTLLELYEKLQSQPYPEDWAAQQRTAFAPEGVSDAGKTVWGAALLAAARRTLDFWSGEMDAACAEIASADAKIQKAYGAAFEDAAAQLRDLRRALDEGWDRACAFSQIQYGRLTALRGYDEPERQERLKAVWNGSKKAAEALAETFSAPSSALLEDMRAASPAMEALMELTLDLERTYAAEKARRGVLDYADLEHLCARLLTDRATGAPTPVALELSRRYQEIMVDEYQDVNAVQERIFNAVSRGGRNLFLVGDVKQSIYRFRLADPGLFLDKYDRFAPFEAAADGAPRRIALQENFRSRKCVLDAVNLVFGGIMSRELGELDYDDAAALRYGAKDYDPAQDSLVEFHLLDPADAEDAPASDALEAGFIARKILAMMRAGVPVTENGAQRRCNWGDFVLLLRSPGGKGRTFHRVLAEAGIPVDSSLGVGFFTSLEVSVTIDLLSVIDNPHADVPLISVLRSPAFGFSADELSAVRAADRDSDFYGALCASAAAGDEKSAAFLEKLELWRTIAPETELPTLIWRLCTETQLLAICAAMRDGETRRRNLMHLLEYARSFSESGYCGVYRFVLWLQRMAERGEEPDTGAPGQAVRILSIHKSKGLEFPFVFLCDLSHRFNRSDTNDCVLLHSALGLGPKRLDAGQGVEYPTLARSAIAQRLNEEMLSEEMRVLYVGMTRAKEKLILTGVWKNAGAKLDDLRLQTRYPVPAELLRGHNSFVHWIAAAALHDPETLPITVHSGAALAAAGAEPVTPEPVDAAAEAAALDALRKTLDFAYPWAGAADLPSKLTATELKDPLESDADAAPMTAQAPPELRFRKAEPGVCRPLTAAQRGTAMHTFLQYADLSRVGTLASLGAEADRLCAEGRLNAQERAVLDLGALNALFDSPLGRQMRGAPGLRREFRFQLLCEARAYFPEGAPDDRLLLQGVVDCCFEEPDGSITVVDYKTDRVSAAEVPARAAHYRGQLLAYAGALERIFARPVHRCVLWFLHTGTQYEIPLEKQEKSL